MSGCVRCIRVSIKKSFPSATLHIDFILFLLRYVFIDIFPLFVTKDVSSGLSSTAGNLCFDGG